MKLLFITYHRTVAEPETDDVHTLTFNQFARHVKLIQQAGVTVAGTHVLERDQPDPGHQIVITFDDGNKSDLVNAELLVRHGMTAMFFISTANIGRDGYLDEDDIRKLDGMGMLIGSHSHQHKRLNKLPTAEARTQLKTSKQCLEAILGHSVQYIAFPGGGYSSSVVAMATELGFRHMMTTDWGVNTATHDSKKRHLYKRNNIMKNMPDSEFIRLITLKSRLRRGLTFFLKRLLRASLPENSYGVIRKLVMSSNTINKSSN